jgi:hypothetical protein
VITTDFFTRCCKNAQDLRLREDFARVMRAVLACCLVALAAPAWAQSQAPATEITQLRVERTDDGVLLSANVKFELPPVIDDALAKGIPMFFVAEAVIFRDRWYWYDKRVALTTRHLRLAFQPLTRRWRLQVSSNPVGQSGLGLGLGQTYDTKDEALAALQRISRWRIADAQVIDPDATHTVDFRFRLDMSQLPRPFQIGAVGQSDWNLSASRSVRLLDPSR